MSCEKFFYAFKVQQKLMEENQIGKIHVVIESIVYKVFYVSFLYFPCCLLCNKFALFFVFINVFRDCASSDMVILN